MLATDLLAPPAPQRFEYIVVPYIAPFARTHKQQHDRDSARLSHSFPWRKEKSKRVTAFHRVRDIDRLAPLSGGRYKYAIREKARSKTVDTKGLGRAGFSEDSF